jgi:hypothetical protein
MLVDSDLNISLSLCDVCPAAEIDDVANALLASFSSRGKIMVLLKAVIEKEVQGTGIFLISPFLSFLFHYITLSNLHCIL